MGVFRAADSVRCVPHSRQKPVGEDLTMRVAQWFWRRVDDVAYNWNANRPQFWWRLVLGASVLSVGLLLQFGDLQSPQQQGDTVLAWEQVAFLIISAGLSYLAGQMLAKDQDSPIQSDKPTTLSIRGSYCSWHVGIHMVGPVFCYAGEREQRKESSGGGKGSSSGPDVEINYETGWHVLCIGPCRAMHKIVQSGKTIFSGPITSESHPSGTTVDLGKEGSFTIYWGEPDQPINAFLGNANRVGINSRWPYLCYVVWNKKRMAGEAWPILNYVVERRPSWTGLSDSQSWYEPNRTLTGPVFVPIDALSSSDEDAGYFEFQGDVGFHFRPSFDVEVVGAGVPDGTYEVLRTSTVQITIGSPPYEKFETHTRLFLQGGTVGATASGTVQVYEEDLTNGANIAHVMGELLFADFPQGLQLNPDHAVERWDLPSLEDLGVEAEDNDWRAAVLGAQGETAEAMLGAMLQDHGTMLIIDTTSGSLLFQRIRFPTGSVLFVVEDVYADSFPEIETILGEKPVDRLVFSFVDRANKFGEMTIAIDNDGQAAFAEHQRARKVSISSTTLFETAAALSELRSPEEMSTGSRIKLSASREARDLLPGQAVLVESFDQVIRVLTVAIDPYSERVDLTVMPDFYGVPLSTFITGEGGVSGEGLDPEQDEAFFWAEIPEQLLDNGFSSSPVLMVPRIRAHAQISFSSIWLSRDNTTYTLKAQDTNVQTGGTLDAELSDSGPLFLDNGPVFTELGPDNSIASDYSADLTSWGLGRQLAVIHSTAGTEICLLQRATIVSGTQRRLDGLLRARYDTRKLTHPAGSSVYIIDSSDITEIQDGLLEPAEDLWVKSQPGTSSGQVNLSAVPPYGNLLYGKGQVPIRPDYLHVRAPYRNSQSYAAGDDVTVGWAISTGTVSTGAGGQSAGAVTGSPEIPGSLTLELLTTGDVVVDTITIDPNDGDSHTFTNAALIAALGSEVSFNVRITHVANGYSSPVSPTITVTKV
jgi:hypothetical protein